MSDFYKYFKENMEALGLTAPDSLFGSQQAAVGTITTILAFTDKHGAKVTVQELVGAGTKLEVLGAMGAVCAAFYAGAAIGSLAVATGRTLSGGTSLGDVLYEASRWDLKREWLSPLLHRLPGIHDSRVSGRRNYRHYRAVK